MKNIYIGMWPMQNCTNFGTLHFSTAQPNMDVSSERHRNKSLQMHKTWEKVCKSVQNSGLFPFYVLTNKI